MMLVMFLGLGISSLLCGISYNQTTLFIGLTFLGLFCAIYHPVAIAWVVNSSKKKGRALGINGIFGVMGIGLGGIFAGFLIELWGWQMAFIVPAILTLVAGGFLGYHILIKKLPLQNSSTAEPSLKNLVDRHSLDYVGKYFLFGVGFSNSKQLCRSY